MFAIAISACAFLLVLLIVNRDLFTVPIFEYTDFAANALQVQRAKHFHELLGNYSRWGFHHPGPAFFYLYALGEKVLHDWLHLVPAEMNAHILCMIFLNTAFLFGSIYIIAGYCRSLLFPPIALGVSLFFIYAVNLTISGSAMVSIWPPHVIMFCFLFFITASASTASGRTQHLPWAVFAGLMLIHGHVAQPLFVLALGACAIAMLWWSHYRRTSWRTVFRENRKPLLISLVLILVFSLPVVLDVSLHKDNNIKAILHHTVLHPGLQQTPMQSLKYASSFLAFVPDPEVVLKNASAKLLRRGASKPYVLGYWLVGTLLVLLAIAGWVRARDRISIFFKYSAFEIVVICALFFYWTLKMTGPLLNFNGYFFFSVQLFALFLLAAFALNRWQLKGQPALAFIVCALLPLTMFASPKGFSNTEKGEPETNLLVKHLPPNDGAVYHLTFNQADWMIEAGVASRMEHAGETFCVDDLWAFPFGRDHVCRKFPGLQNLVLTHTPRTCEAPCQVLTQDQRFEFEVEPYPTLKLPFTIKPDDLSSLNKGFNEGLGTLDPVWTKGLATIYFLAAPDSTGAGKIRIRIYGSANPDRPAHILLNEKLLGTITAGHDVTEFTVPRDALVAGENRLVIQVDNPQQVMGDPQNDPRVLGFSFLKAEFEPVQ